ncbi:SDR family NAD(P)-dependent oxidoreductase [Cellulosimicrobium protaetiae]|uniref:SDR family NAD(P)-dependent oxidoreductase n=1 Tax=Cellulosimicrobium protaetiae TaxID=2587808 RepID=A0A6M5UN04_9MICO|nr:SDR family NAD(P)-dependent oxidoreductase [Cellulosimicrobium protaetiae]QJW38239.1 SDR family NAD(P)-dependent oxidoreductase [Cellulosimicrobium protaetiae]
MVTGGSRGLGLAVVEALATDGATVVLAGRRPDAVRDVVASLRARGLDVSGVTLDVDDPASVRSAAAEVSARHDHLDVLVNNAGILPEASPEPGDEAPRFADPTVFERTFRTNVFGAVAVIEEFLPLLERSRAGRVVNVSSTMGSLADQQDPASPYFGLVVPAYQASKAALNAVTVSLAKQLAGTRVKVTSVCPGWVQTDLAPGNHEQAPTPPAEAARVVVRAARLPDDAASGSFLSATGAVAW